MGNINNFISIIFLIFSPLFVGIIILLPIFSNNDVLIRRFAKSFSILHFLYSLCFLALLNPNDYSVYFHSTIDFGNVGWLKSIAGSTFSFALDGLSAVLVVLTSFITMIVLIISKLFITNRYKLYYALILLLQTTILGVFCAQDAILFFLFWELELLPMYFLISLFGNSNSKLSAMKFLIYTFISSIFLFLGILMLIYYNFQAFGILTCNLTELTLEGSIYPLWLKSIIFFSLFIGFGIKMPIVPFHSWLKPSHTDACTPVSIILAGLLLKMGAYGFIRFNMQILSDVFVIFTPILLSFGIVSYFYGSILAFVQKDIKRIVAFCSISSMGLVLVGLSTATSFGFKGAFFLMISHAILVSLLFFICGIIEMKTNTRFIFAIKGLGERMPILMCFATLTSLFAMNVPIFANFPAEFMTLLAVINMSFVQTHLKTLLALLLTFGAILTCAYILRFLHKIFFGKISEQFQNISDISSLEFTILTILISSSVLFGTFPQSLLNFVNTLSTIILDTMQV